MLCCPRSYDEFAWDALQKAGRAEAMVDKHVDRLTALVVRSLKTSPVLGGLEVRHAIRLIAVSIEFFVWAFRTSERIMFEGRRGSQLR